MLLGQGASNPHPHGQVWATSFVPTEPATVLRSLAEYAAAPATRGRNLLEDYARDEQTLGKGERMCVPLPWPLSLRARRGEER